MRGISLPRSIFLISIRALSNRFEDSQTKAALKISEVKAEIESEKSKIDKTLDEVTPNGFNLCFTDCILKLKDTVNSIYKTLRDSLQTIDAGM